MYGDSAYTAQHLEQRGAGSGYQVEYALWKNCKVLGKTRPQTTTISLNTSTAERPLAQLLPVCLGGRGSTHHPI